MSSNVAAVDDPLLETALTRSEVMARYGDDRADPTKSVTAIETSQTPPETTKPKRQVRKYGPEYRKPLPKPAETQLAVVTATVPPAPTVNTSQRDSTQLVMLISQLVSAGMRCDLQLDGINLHVHA
jgi:hypothetical protein